MLSITKTTALLHISKFRLLKLLEQENITTIKSGNKKLLSEDQIEHLKSVIQSNRQQADFFSTNETVKEVSTKIELEVHKEIVKDLKDQISYLQQQLAEEKQERSELSKGILAVQSQMFKVQQALEVRSNDNRKVSFIQRMFRFQ